MKLIPLSRQQFTKVSDHWFEPAVLVGPWYCLDKGDGNLYASRFVGHDDSGKKVEQTLQDLILPPPVGYRVDHINRDSLDNQDFNLRLATCSQNQANREVNKNNTSGFKGVSWDKGTQRWRAYIMVNYKRTHLGLFNTAIEAARAYDAAALHYFGEFAVTNASLGLIGDLPTLGVNGTAPVPQNDQQQSDIVYPDSRPGMYKGQRKMESEYGDLL